MSLDLPITRIQHTGIPVTDLAASKAFYAGLGFADAMSSTFPHPEGTGHVCMMQRGDIILELYEFPAAALAEIRARSNGHIDHIAFDVPTSMPRSGLSALQATTSSSPHPSSCPSGPPAANTSTSPARTANASSSTRSSNTVHK